MSEDGLRGIERPRLDEWLAANLAGARAPFGFRLIAAGGSNLTYRVEDAGARVYVLRRPPAKTGLATAHDMQREWRVLRALGEHATGVPVPRVLAACDDESVTGARFYVMEFVDGLILRDAASAAGLDAASARTAMRVERFSIPPPARRISSSTRAARSTVSQPMRKALPLSRAATSR